MARVMARLLTDSDLRKHVITAGSKRVVQEFDNSALIHDLASVYKREIF